MNQSDPTDVPLFSGKTNGRPRRLWLIPTIAAVVTAGLTALSIVLDAGNERSRDLALLIGAAFLAMLVITVVSEPLHVFLSGLWVVIRDGWLRIADWVAG